MQCLEPTAHVLLNRRPLAHELLGRQQIVDRLHDGHSLRELPSHANSPKDLSLA